MSGDLSGCLFSLGARSAAGSSGTSAVGDFAGDVGGVVIGEGEKSGCEGGGGENAGEVGVGEMWVGEESKRCVESSACCGSAVVAWRGVGCPVDAAGLLVLSGLTLLDGEANSSSDKNPIWTESGIAFEFH